MQNSKVVSRNHGPDQAGPGPDPGPDPGPTSQLNVKIKGCDLVIELQLHLQDIIQLKEEAHKICTLV